jgi:hypothetical protein
MNKPEAVSVLGAAQKLLEQNAHLVKKGEPRDAVLTAIHMVAEVKHWLITNEALEPL